MGPVDGFDPLTASNSGLRSFRRGVTQVLEHWLLRGVLANTYVIAQIWRREEGLPALRLQKKWRESIIEGLLEQSKRVQKDMPVHPKDRISHRKRPRPDTDECDHVVSKMKKKVCSYCAGQRRWDRPFKRVARGSSGR